MKTGPLFTVNSISKVAVTALTVCRRITVAEDPSVTGWPTVGYLVYVPTQNDGPLQKDAGQEQVFEKPHGRFFTPGEVAGYVATLTGSTSFNQYED